MFDGAADQYHQFIASSRAQSLPIPFSFSLHGPSPAAASNFTSFDPYNSSSHHHHLSSLLQQPPPPKQPSTIPHLLHHHHQHHHQHQQQELPPPPSLVAAAATKKGSDEEKEDQENSSSLLLSTSLVLQQQQQQQGSMNTSSVLESGHDSIWSDDEVLALLRIRSSLETWFPDFTWEHVSRKLAELGFKRSPEKCKEKFEEESRNFNGLSYNKNYNRFFTELDELYTNGQNQNPDLHEATPEKDIVQDDHQEEGKQEEGGVDDKMGQISLEKSSSENVEMENQEIPHEEVVARTSKNRKRKRKHQFEMFKGFCEAIVHKLMAQQEDLHNKLVEDIVKREEEKIAREEAWKVQELNRMNKEIEIRAQEQAVASDRQAMIIEFLKKFTPLGPSEDQSYLSQIGELLKVIQNSNSSASSSQDPSDHNFTAKSQQSSHCNLETAAAASTSSGSSILVSHQNPVSLTTQNSPVVPLTSSIDQNPSSTSIDPSPTKTNKSSPSAATSPHAQRASHKSDPASNDKGDPGKRWPRDEVLALINLRCSVNNNNSTNNNGTVDQNKEGANKGPLWERISQGMMELGYKRSAKRCKEKWENINKYFRKTKDSTKKRSLDSRTCPYFHQLSYLYSQGTLVGPSEVPENHST